MCFIANTYSVIVHNKRAVFKHPIKFHLLQSILCWLVPAVIVVGCRFIAPPGYKFLFVDHMAAGPGSLQMAYFAVTLPMQVSLGVSLCLLWSIVWNLRKVKNFYSPVKPSFSMIPVLFQQMSRQNDIDTVRLNTHGKPAIKEHSNSSSALRVLIFESVFLIDQLLKFKKNVHVYYFPTLLWRLTLAKRFSFFSTRQSTF